LTDLAEVVEEARRLRRTLRQVVELADDVLTLTDRELRDRLFALADRAVSGSRWAWSIGPDLLAAMRLLDAAKAAGFTFQRVAPGPDGPLLGVREGIEYRDEIATSVALASVAMRAALAIRVWSFPEACR
jgi:hypothetical protein